jgi:hypothetical protein
MSFPRVVAVAPASPAAVAGLLPDDEVRSIRSRTRGSVAWMLTCSGESRWVTTRSRSASVKRVSVVKFP